ncbi:MAG: heme exporter protein CcmB [candidate division KSB1 bacterium]|nr:heme exporter protein CcmB [candidate division KSB1 bacterium]MDZ7333695.1 heme exporter protein CcmB [candidate division KSB1 bacterium]MDZ7356143.1 heme exporter protein CcmB [candidate division KSB1 bacterium]MDZ7398879.1 heme exporter protein CcmB [candidate division KSB1 bacterium]
MTMPPMITIAWKDILSELRSRETISSMLIFCLIVVVIFNFMFEPGSTVVKQMVPGILWVAITFAGLLGLNRSFIYEVDQGCLMGLLLCPVDHYLLYLGKMIGNFLFMVLMEVIMLPLMIVLFNLDIFAILLPLLSIILLGTLGFATVGTLLSAISVNTRAREILLPILLFPIAIPVLLAAVKATSSLINQESLAGAASWLRILIGFDIIFLVMASLLFEYVVEE